MSSEYKTIAVKAEAVFREKMSRFISFAFPVESEDEARSRIDEIRNEYHDARHVCWAFVLGADRKRQLSNDNGEPSGTAGKPILGQINSFGLTNIVIIVVRYFGGIKLGTSGLIAAYREAARLSIEASQIIDAVEETEFNVTFGYLSMNNVMKAVKNMGLNIVAQQFDNTCRMTIRVRRDQAETLKSRLQSIEGVVCD